MPRGLLRGLPQAYRLAGGMQRDAAAGRRTPAWGPLALTAGLHLLLVLAWLAGPERLPARPAAQDAEAAFVLVAPLAGTRSPSSRERQPERQPVPPPAGAADAPAVRTPAPDRSRERAALHIVQGAGEAAPEGADAPAADAAFADPGAAPAAAADGAAAPGARLPGDLLGTSRRMAGPIDRELRKGGSPITAEPDRKWERFANAVAGARVAPAGAVTLAVYTAPDGVSIYRKTVGNRVSCYRSGGVGGLGPADGHSAGVTACPTGVSWTRL